jgi:hypothetical protein
LQQRCRCLHECLCDTSRMTVYRRLVTRRCEILMREWLNYARSWYVSRSLYPLRRTDGPDRYMACVQEARVRTIEDQAEQLVSVSRARSDVVDVAAMTAWLCSIQAVLRDAVEDAGNENLSLRTQLVRGCELHPELASSCRWCSVLGFASSHLMFCIVPFIVSWHVSRKRKCEQRKPKQSSW